MSIKVHVANVLGILLKFSLKVLYHRQCQYTHANEYHFDGANSIKTTNH